MPSIRCRTLPHIPLCISSAPAALNTDKKFMFYHFFRFFNILYVLLIIYNEYCYFLDEGQRGEIRTPFQPRYAPSATGAYAGTKLLRRARL